MTNDVFARNIQSAKEKFQPLFGTLEITQSCNLKCKHCYNFDRSKVPTFKDELSLQEIYQTLDDLSELGVLSLNISGGEPLLHPNLEEIFDYAFQHHFHLRLKTNGTFLTPEKAKRLKEKGLKEVDISLYGKDEETYLNFCGKEGYTKTLESIKSALSADIKTNVSVILHRYNAQDLTQMLSTLDELGAFYHISDEITDRYDKTKASDQLSLTEQQYIELLKGPHSHFFSHKNPEKDLMCGCAKSVIGINALGEIYPCIGSPISCGNIRTHSLSEVWKNSPILNRIRNLENKDFKDCQSCELITSCSRSSGSAQINTGNYTGCDPVARTLASARAKYLKFTE